MAVGYKKDENFKPVIHKAMELCNLNWQDVNYHFPLMQQMIEIGKGGHRKVESYRLSHHACLLCPMSLNSKKEISISIQLSKKLG